jgi:glutathione S-transferase
VLNPARETPVLELDDGTILTQSNAILWFLGEGTRFLPESPLERACWKPTAGTLVSRRRLMLDRGRREFRLHARR